MNPIKKLKMEDALIPESQKDAAYYWDLTAKYNRIGEMYNRRSSRYLKWAAVFLSIALFIEVYVLFF